MEENKKKKWGREFWSILLVVSTSWVVFSSWNVWSNWNAVLSKEGERGDIKDWRESEGKSVNIEKDNKGKTIKKAKDLSRITEKLGKKRKNKRKNEKKYK